LQYSHVAYALVTEESKRFIQQLLRKRIIVLIASPPGLVEHALPESMMSAETYRVY